jgi:hypothetical protein
MGTGQDESGPQRPGPVVPADLASPYPSPIVVSGGKGSYLRLLTPGTVIDRLGGLSALNDRINAIAASEPYRSGEVSDHDAAELATHYDTFLARLEVVSYPTPIHTDPTGGWSVTIPMPESVIEKLGGPSQLRTRLASMQDSASAADQAAQAGPVDMTRLTADYEGLLGQIETVIKPPAT